MIYNNEILVNENLQNFENSLLYAKTIQNGLLPKKRHFEKYTKNHFLIYEPQHKIGGDFYWITKKNDTVFFALADCTGHGVSGAMLTVLGISLLNYVIQKNYSCVGDYLTELDKKWIETFNNEFIDANFNNDWLEVTLLAYNTKTKKCTYASANGEFLVAQNNKIEILHGDSFPIGGWQIEHNRSFNTFDLDLTNEAVFLFFSDGIIHQFNEDDNKKFSKKQLVDSYNEIYLKPFAYQKEFMQYVLKTWRGTNSLTDDMTMVGLQF